MSSMVAHAAADRQRHEAGFRRAPDHVQHDAAVLVGRGDVEKAELVGAGGVIGDRRFDGIAGVAQVDEIDALDHAAVLDVEAGDDADLEHSSLLRPPARALRISASAADWIEPAVIERAAGDRAGELLCPRRQHRLDVLDRGERRPRR